MAGDSAQRKRPRSDPLSTAERGQTSQGPVTDRFPWPDHEEGREILAPMDFWEETGKELLSSSTFLDREDTEEWDAFDTMLYNAWLKVNLSPTRLIHQETFDSLGLSVPVQQCIDACGLGHMPYTEYDFYPDLVRQFMASVRIRYSDSTVIRHASKGILSFKLRGIRHTLSFHDLCAVYGFDAEPEGCLVPGSFDTARAVWQRVTGQTYDARSSVQASIRHPVLRILMKVITNTILCKAEANKMRVEELSFLHYAVGMQFYPDTPDVFQRSAVNMGAIFAHHLVDLQKKPFIGKKQESVGSLLTPLFQRVGAIPSSYTCDVRREWMNKRNLASTKIVLRDRTVHFIMRGFEWSVKLPAEDLTAVDSPDAVRFLPPADDDRLIRHGQVLQVEADDEEDEADAEMPGADPEEWPEIVFPSELQQFAPAPPPAVLTVGERYIIREQRKQTAFLLRMWERITCRGSTSTAAGSPRRQRSRSPPQL